MLVNNHLNSQSNNVNFKNFKYKNLEYYSEKMTPATKKVFKKAKKTMERKNVDKVNDNFLGVTFEKTTPATLNNGQKVGAYITTSNKSPNPNVILTNNGEVGVYYRHYDYIKKERPSYDINKSAQDRIKKLTEQ